MRSIDFARDDRPKLGLRMSRTRICQNLRNLWIALWLFALSQIAHAQTLMPMPASSPSASPEEETIVPTFETQKLARTFMLDIPAPRGQITDRNGVPLAQNRLSYNLVITFPTPLELFRCAGAQLHEGKNR